ncbi:hypothetical protein KSX_86720 [Ktedonospora formicarum]|uniref:Uncharacterized protein n=1 Tax=Ktedonospora formicarum TaxID=2778364 RepID=A0A8J3IEH4_9CHLR|nr:hypothetical protein KSX_86720 [Ktedonospora formicarum]
MVEATERRAFVHLHVHAALRLMCHRGDDLKRGAYCVDGVQDAPWKGSSAQQPVLLEGVLGTLQCLLVVTRRRAMITIRKHYTSLVVGKQARQKSGLLT